MAKLGELFISNAADHMLLNILGIITSIYALYVEINKHRNKNYKALCDFSENMSCSRVLTSKYSKGFGLVEFLVGKDSFLNMPNCFIGIIFYTAQVVIGSIPSGPSIYVLCLSSVVSCIGSLYLAVILVFVLKDFCLLCCFTYVLNAGIMYLNYQKFVAMDVNAF